MQKCKAVFASDIDNTLTDERHLIPDEVANYIAQLYESGFAIVFLTGRTFSFAYMSMEKFSFPYLLAVQNGADLLEMPDKKISGQNYLSYDVLETLHVSCRHLSKGFLVYAGFEKGDFCYYCKKECSEVMLSYFEIHKRLAAAEWQEVEDWKELSGVKFPLIKCIGTEETILQIQAALVQQKAPANAVMIRDVIDPGLHLLLVTHPKANKGRTIQEMQELYQWNCPIIAAGDDNNDIELLKYADIGIGMEDGAKGVLQVADIVAKPSRQCGIIRAVEEARERLGI